jgi:hypothetical protein
MRPRRSKEKPNAPQDPQWRPRGEMNIRDRVRLVGQLRFEKELRLLILGIQQVLKHQKRLEISRPKLVGQAKACNQVPSGGGPLSGRFTHRLKKPSGMTMPPGIFGACFFLLIGTHGRHAAAAALITAYVYMRLTRHRLGPGHLRAA